jgi:Tfp pilus assembly protein PilF
LCPRALCLSSALRSDVAGALSSYEGAVSREPSYFKALFNLATCHAALGHFQEAEAALRRAVAARPGCGRAAGALGETLLRVRRAARGHALCTDARKRSPDSVLT